MTNCKYETICGVSQGIIECKGKYGCLHYELIEKELAQDKRNGISRKKALNLLVQEADRDFGRMGS